MKYDFDKSEKYLIPQYLINYKSRYFSDSTLPNNFDAILRVVRTERNTFKEIHSKEIQKIISEKYNKNEDTLFVLEVVKKANTFVRIGLPLYHYTYKKTTTYLAEK